MSDGGPSAGTSEQRTTSRRRLLQVTAGGTVAGLAGCLGGGDGGSADTFTIGANLELSQGWSPWGETILNAAELAAQEINDNGGLGPNGAEVDVIADDNQVDPSTARDVALQHAQEDGADLLFGPISSAQRVAISDVAASEEIPLIYPVQYEGHVAEDYCNEWLFKTESVPVQNIEPFIPWLVDNFGTDFYMIGSDYNWPHQINSVSKPILEEAGGTVVDEEYVQLGTSDFSSIVLRIQEADPDVLYMTLTGGEPAAIQQEMLDRGLRDEWQDVGFAHGQAAIGGIDAAAVEGVISCHNYAELMENDANQAFVERYYDEFGDDAVVNYMTGPAYVSILLLEQALADAEDTAPETIKERLPGTGIEDSVVGFTEFERDHQLTLDAVAKRMNSDKKFEVVKQFDPVTPDEHCEAI